MSQIFFQAVPDFGSSTEFEAAADALIDFEAAACALIDFEAAPTR